MNLRWMTLYLLWPYEARGDLAAADDARQVVNFMPQGVSPV